MPYFLNKIFHAPKPDAELGQWLDKFIQHLAITNKTMKKQLQNFIANFKKTEDFSEYYATKENLKSENQKAKEKNFLLLKKLYLALEKAIIDPVLRKNLQNFIHEQLNEEQSNSFLALQTEIMQAAMPILEQLKSLPAGLVSNANIEAIVSELNKKALPYAELRAAMKPMWLNNQLRYIAAKILDPDDQRFMLKNNNALDNLLLNLDERVDRCQIVHAGMP